MSKTKKVFKIKLLVSAYSLLLVASVLSPTGRPTDKIPIPPPAQATAAATLVHQPIENETPPPNQTKPQTVNSPTKKEPIIRNDRISYPVFALTTPNDPVSSSSWNHSVTGLRPAWDITTGSASTVVAVIDTGFAFGHQDLANRYWNNPGESGTTGNEGPSPNCSSRGLALDKQCNNLDDDGNGYVDDWKGWDFEHNDNNANAGSTAPSNSSASHGTWVAGIIGASGNNGLGIAGINWNAKIMPLQGLDDDGTGYTDTIADAIRYAVDNGAQVINLSLGSQYNDSYLQSAVTYAVNHNVSVVAAAGNDGCNCLLYPANYSSVVAVGASTSSDVKASYSSYGANLDLLAPGSSICSTSWSNSNQTTGYTCSINGTSFAAPHVAGAISLLLARRPGLPPSEVEQFLKNSSDRVPAMSGATYTIQYGYGRLNFYRLLLSATIPISFGATSEKPNRTISLSDPENISTLCQSTGSSCTLEFTKDGQTIRLPAQTVDQWRDTTFYWDPSDVGLTAGVWEVRAIEPVTGRSIEPVIQLTLVP